MNEGAKKPVDTNRECASARAYQDHLAGMRALGLVPVNKVGLVWFAVIDIDVETIDLAGLARDCARRKMPVTVCRSFSGGVHVFIFFSTPQPARSVREMLKRIAAALGYPNTEIFPKQNRVNPKNLGNGIFLPYLSGNQSTQYALGLDGGSLTLEGFIRQANKLRVTDLAQLAEVDLTPAPLPGAKASAGPSLRDTVAGPVAADRNWHPFDKIPDGSRNPTLRTVGIRAIEMLGLNVKEVGAALRVFNETRCEHPLPEAEVEQVIRALESVTPKRKIEEIHPLLAQSLTEFLEPQDAHDTAYAVDRLIQQHGLVNIIGPPKAGKSRDLQEMATAVAADQEVFKKFRVKPGQRAMYADFEQSRAETLYRQQDIGKGYNQREIDPSRLYLVTRNSLHAARMMAHEISDRRSLRRGEFSLLLQKLKIDLLCVAAIRSVVKPGKNLKDMDAAEDVNEWVEWLRQETGVTLVMAHHANKSGTGSIDDSFGSTMLSAPADAVFIIRREGDLRRVITKYSRYPVTPDFLLKLEQSGAGGHLLRVTSDPDEERKAQIQELYEKTRSCRKVADALGISHSTVARQVEAIRAREAETKKADEAKNGAQANLLGKEV